MSKLLKKTVGFVLASLKTSIYKTGVRLRFSLAAASPTVFLSSL